MKNKAAFMGRNGMLHNIPKAGKLNIADFHIFDMAMPALNLLGQNGYVLNVITNEKGPQSGGVDYINLVHQIENHIRNMVYSPIYFRYCHHHHAKKCLCRLPKPGLINDLVEEHNIDLRNSFMFATSQQEIKAAEAAGIDCIIRINTGKADWKENNLPLYSSFHEAVLDITNNG